MSILNSGRISLILITTSLTTLSAFAGPLYRPGQEQRTVTASSYQISVQKNGRIDVSLLNGEPVFFNAYPAILLEGEKEWTELDIASRFTFRERVNDVLGQGQALIMAKGNCEWAIRTYSAEPFFIVQAVFINTTKKPVRVLAASPWTTGDTRKPGGVWLGENTPQSHALTFKEQPQGFVNSRLEQGVPVKSLWQTCLFNAETGRSLIGGFLELSADESAFSLDRLPQSADNAPIELFQAATTYKEPIELAPGDRLEMPMLYFAVSESDPLLGLRRFGQALGRFNGVRIERSQDDTGEAQGSARFFQGERGDFARLSPSAPTSWEDVVDDMTRAVRLFHLNSYFWQTEAGRPQLSMASLTNSQRLAWISGLALSGSVTNAELAPDASFADTLRRFTPTPDRSARPVDLFRNEQPRIWALPMDSFGEHVVVGLFNWDSNAPVTIDLKFAELGLARDTFYTVYESLPRKYLGTASEQLHVEVPPGSVRIVSLRRHADRPAVLTYGDHFTTESSPDDDSKWDGRTNTVTGTVHPMTEEPARIDILVPERFGTTTSSSDNVRVKWRDNERVLTLFVSGAQGTAAKWRVEFK